jgi:predicted enzyme related to lactoylglutathione lyase
VVLKDPSGSSPNVSVNQKNKPLSKKIRLHLDLYTSDQKAEVERLLKIGATIVRPPKKGSDFTILADPEGNHFCVVQKGKP